MLPHPAVILFAICHLPASCVDLTVSALNLLRKADLGETNVHIHLNIDYLSHQEHSIAPPPDALAHQRGGQKTLLSQHSH